MRKCAQSYVFPRSYERGYGIPGLAPRHGEWTGPPLSPGKNPDLLAQRARPLHSDRMSSQNSVKGREGGGGTGRRGRLLIYLFPALVDVVVAQVIFINTVRVAGMGGKAVLATGVAAAWGVVYTAVAFLSARFVTSRTAPRLMMGACISLSVLCLLFTVLPGILAIYLLVMCVGAATALFFAPFQVFMKAVDSGPGKPLTTSVGIYTFSWSMGFAVGPFVSGLLMQVGSGGAAGEGPGWKLAYLVGALAAAVTAGGIHWLSPSADRQRAPGETVVPDVGRYSRLPDLAWLGWCVAGLGVLARGSVFTLFPVQAVRVLDIAVGKQGLVLFLLSFAQGVTALVLAKAGMWMYRWRLPAFFGCLGAAGVILFMVSRSVVGLCVAAVCFGAYCGSMFFYVVFHSLTHPQRSARYISINESVVGINGILGPALAGLLADMHGFGFPYIVVAVMIALMTSAQVWVHRRNDGWLRGTGADLTSHGDH